MESAELALRRKRYVESGRSRMNVADLRRRRTLAVDATTYPAH